jgi:hypothetical protein
MSTRACYTFKDETETFHVYKHHDGYPSGAEKWIRNAICLAWQMPRFEASDFGAAFVAANKNRPGSVRLMETGDIEKVAPGDLAYRYEIEQRNGGVWVTAFRMPFNAPSEQIWAGHIDAMSDWIETTKQN